MLQKEPSGDSPIIGKFRCLVLGLKSEISTTTLYFFAVVVDWLLKEVNIAYVHDMRSNSMRKNMRKMKKKG